MKDTIPSKELSTHKFTKNVEGIFVEINLRKLKPLLSGTYR